MIVSLIFLFSVSNVTNLLFYSLYNTSFTWQWPTSCHIFVENWPIQGKSSSSWTMLLHTGLRLFLLHTAHDSAKHLPSTAKTDPSLQSHYSHCHYY